MRDTWYNYRSNGTTSSTKIFRRNKHPATRKSSENFCRPIFIFSKYPRQKCRVSSLEMVSKERCHSFSYCIWTGCSRKRLWFEISGLEKLVATVFATHHFSYARYGSYYVEILEKIKTVYPGLQNLLIREDNKKTAMKRLQVKFFET